MEDGRQSSFEQQRPMLNLVFRVLSTAAGASGLVLGVESSQPAEADLPSVMSIQNHLGATVLESPGLVLADSTSRTPLPKPLNTLPGDPAAEQAAAPPQVSGSDSSPSPAAPSSPVSSARAPLPKPVIVLAGDTPARPVLEKPVLVLPGDPNAPHDPAPAQPADPNSGQPPAQAPGESGSGGGATQTTTGQPRPGTEPDPAKVPNPTGEPAPATPQPPAAPAPTPAPPETPTNSLPPIASQIPERVAATMLPGADKATLDIAYPLILKALDEQGIADKDMVLYTFATISVETSTAEPIAEYGGTHARYAPYYGRGYVQLTWDYNYEAAGKALGIDLLHNPDLAMKPEIAARILAWYMKTHEQRLRTAFANNDLAAARKVVNGGTNGLAKFTDSWNAGLALVG